MGKKKDEDFLKGKRLGGRSAIVEARITAPVKKHKPRVLTAQEWKFVEEFVSGDGHVTLREAALRAGYSEVWAKNRARELTDPDQSPHIVAAIQERRRELGEKYGTTWERHMRDLQIIRDQALQAGAYGAAVQAEYRRGQALGTIYIDRKEIRHGTIDSMSKDEVMRKLEEIKKLYGGGMAGPITDIEPIQIENDPELVEEASESPQDDPEEGEAGVVATEDAEAVEGRLEGQEAEEKPNDETGGVILRSAARQSARLPYLPPRK